TDPDFQLDCSSVDAKRAHDGANRVHRAGNVCVRRHQILSQGSFAEKKAGSACGHRPTSSIRIWPQIARSNTKRTLRSFVASRVGATATRSEIGMTYDCSTISNLLANRCCSRFARRKMRTSSGRRGTPYRVTGTDAVTPLASVTCTVKSTGKLSGFGFGTFGGL